MGIDTKDKRLGSMMSRRLPWMRRFIPLPDSSVALADMAQLTGTYRSTLVDIDDPDNALGGGSGFSSSEGFGGPSGFNCRVGFKN